MLKGKKGNFINVKSILESETDDTMYTSSERITFKASITGQNRTCVPHCFISLLYVFFTISVFKNKLIFPPRTLKEENALVSTFKK